MHQYQYHQYQTREVNTPYKYILPVFMGAKYKCEIFTNVRNIINANDHHGPLHSVICRSTCVGKNCTGTINPYSMLRYEVLILNWYSQSVITRIQTSRDE